MDVRDLAELIVSISAVLVAVGGGIKWLLSHIDAKAALASAALQAANSEIRLHLEKELGELRSQVAILTARETIYLRRVLQLEAHIRAKAGEDLPAMEGWPP